MIRYDKRDGSVSEYGRCDDPYSRVYVVTMPDSSIANIPVGEDYLDAVYKVLAGHGLSGMEMATYYLFDRDWRSNAAEAVLSKIGLLRNAYDNGHEMPGALLLSYPCLQAYYCQAHGLRAEFSESQDAKAFVNANRLIFLSDAETLNAANHMLACLANLRSKAFSLTDLDD